jgi:hypothetical protein
VKGKQTMTNETTHPQQPNIAGVPPTPSETHQPAANETYETEKQTAHSCFGALIYAYSRAQALEDGVLVDVSESACEAGFRYPVAMTQAAWQDCVEWSEADSQRQTYQDEAGRLWDVLWMASLAARRGNGERLPFQLYRVPRGGRGVRARLTTLHMQIGPGDQGEPVITILLPGED